MLSEPGHFHPFEQRPFILLQVVATFMCWNLLGLIQWAVIPLKLLLRIVHISVVVHTLSYLAHFLSWSNRSRKRSSLIETHFCYLYLGKQQNRQHFFHMIYGKWLFDCFCGCLDGVSMFLSSTSALTYSFTSHFHVACIFAILKKLEQFLFILLSSANAQFKVVAWQIL